MASAYHPQPQGALERYHQHDQTLKTMIKAYCFDNQQDWDEGIHLLFATREIVQESLGFGPFELVFGHTVRGLLKIVEEGWLQDDKQYNLLDYVSEFNMFKYRLYKACDLAHENLKETQEKMKTWYDKESRERVFNVDDRVLVLLPIPGEPLRAKFSGPYAIDKTVSDVDYIVCTSEIGGKP